MKFILLLLICLIPQAAIGESLVWYKWDTPNFIILSLDDAQGRQIAGQIETIKSSVLTRWGLPDIQYIKKCKVVCVPNRDYLKKIFRLNDHSAESRDGESACWVAYDEMLYSNLSVFLTEIGLSELELKQRIKIGYWARRGMSLLNGDLQRVRRFIAPFVNQPNKIFLSRALFSISKEEVLRSSAENTILYDREVVLLCLMLRREFGQRQFLMLIADSSLPRIEQSTGYRSYAAFDSALRRYLYYAAQDINTGRMPNSYLSIAPK